VKGITDEGAKRPVTRRARTRSVVLAVRCFVTSWFYSM